MLSSQLQDSGRKIGRARVSTDEQTLYQHQDALKRAGWKTQNIFYDDATRATAKNREGLSKAMAALKPGDVFVVVAIDRAFRSSLDGLKFLEGLDKEGITFHSIYQQIDTGTPEGRKWFAYQLADAEYELAVISRRTKEKMAAAKARGQHLGRPFKLSKRSIYRAHMLVTEKGRDIDMVTKTYSVAPITLKRAFERLGLEAA
ncbi:recombinase family protein [Roseibium sp. MMSF_3544]|uniref:recombinase family protein n=1 Tax=unclassified Roseibium TaxID=2629323 RepID=UPI00273DABB0|nr:recombinase family protein [Roseibium sp. MMSF_3544]